jgi:hypothetical protein
MSDLDNEKKRGKRRRAYPFWFAFKVSTRLDMAELGLWLLNIKRKFLGELEMQPRFIQMMAYFLVYGYSAETRKRYAEASGYTENSIRQMVSVLIHHGLIVRNSQNQRRFELSPQMEQLGNFVRRQVSDEYIKSFGFLIKEGR